VEIRDLATYAIGVARMLLREMSRERVREARPLDQAPEPRVLPFEPENYQEARLECLRRCMAQLSLENRDLILSYYRDDKSQKIQNRRRLTELLGLPAGALRMRALRLRETLQLCTENCCQRGNRL
jgi:DNA-directed RNA polymerase specialized sigma24 family protein